MVAPNETINFTKRSLEALPCPPSGKRFSFKDNRERGLIARKTATGRVTFQLYQKHEGRPVRVTLGVFPDMTVEQARRAAQQAKGELATGSNPNVEKHRIRGEMTLGQLFGAYMERYSKPQKKSWRYDEREIPKFLSHWFTRRISSLTRHEITKLHQDIRDRNGLYQANRLLERLRSMYNKAIEWGWDGLNPTTGIKKFKEQSRDRFILPSELPYLFAAIEREENEVARDYVLLSLFTGARKSNVLAMRWDQVQWDRGIWRIPDTKNGEPLEVPLIAPALDVLQRRKEANQSSPWVLPSETSSTGYLRDPKKAWARIRCRASLDIWRQDEAIAALLDEVAAAAPPHTEETGIVRRLQAEADARAIDLPQSLMDIRLHDIRRTLGSYQAIGGSSMAIIGKSLGHKSAAATEVYARLHHDPVRASMEQAAKLMIERKELVE